MWVSGTVIAKAPLEPSIQPQSRDFFCAGAINIWQQARIQGGGGALGRAPTPGTEGPAPSGRNKGHWCLLNGCSTPFRHNMAINILKSCKSVFAHVKNRSFPSDIRSSFPWRPPLAEILDPRLGNISTTTGRIELKLAAWGLLQVRNGVFKPNSGDPSAHAQ